MNPTLGYIAQAGDHFLKPILAHLSDRYRIKKVESWPDPEVDVLWFIETKSSDGWEIGSDAIEIKGDAEQEADEWRRKYGYECRVTAFRRMGADA